MSSAAAADGFNPFADDDTSATTHTHTHTHKDKDNTDADANTPPMNGHFTNTLTPESHIQHNNNDTHHHQNNDTHTESQQHDTTQTHLDTDHPQTMMSASLLSSSFPASSSSPSINFSSDHPMNFAQLAQMLLQLQHQLMHDCQQQQQQLELNTQHSLEEQQQIQAQIATLQAALSLIQQQKADKETQVKKLRTTVDAAQLSHNLFSTQLQTSQQQLQKFTKRQERRMEQSHRKKKNTHVLVLTEQTHSSNKAHQRPTITWHSHQHHLHLLAGKRSGHLQSLL